MTKQDYTILQRDDFIESHPALLEGLAKWIEEDETKKTHFFHQRYENIFISADRIPQIQAIIDCAMQHTATSLNCEKSELSLSFWFNIMKKGDVTTRHSHDDGYEVLSGTYYIKANENDAALILYPTDDAITITPKEGRFVFFSPGLVHEVAEQTCDSDRISIGFNLGFKKNNIVSTNYDDHN